MSDHIVVGGMDHDEMRRRCYADLYLSGELPEPDAEAYEEHFFDCAECKQDLEAARSFRAGMRDTAPPGAPKRYWPGVGAAVAAALLLAIVPAWVVRRQMDQQVQSASSALSAERSAHLADLARLRTQLQADARVVRLDLFRSAARAETRMPRFEGFTILELSEPPAAAGTHYRARLFDSANQAVWTREGLTTSAEGNLAVALPPSVGTGSFRLSVDQIAASGAVAATESYPIRFE